MAGVYYEQYGLPLQIKMASLEGKFAYHPNVGEMIVTASAFGEQGRMDIFSTFIHCTQGSMVSRLMNIMDVIHKDKQDGFMLKRWVYSHLEQKHAVVVNVLVHFDNKVEVFTSFLTGSSIQAYEGLVKGMDLSALITKVNTPLRSKYLNCAYCMSHYKGACRNEPSVKARLERPLKKCGRCKSVFYCSEQCQKADKERGHGLACEVFAWLSPRVEKDGTEEAWLRHIGRTFGMWVGKALDARGASFEARTPDGRPIEYSFLTPIM